ncbi:hypothetical protein P3342_004368 [Pyrenophora teres f. teres]|nr:hypothetical protein P3342_004368 [Pyrenophora teres f. teres]
MPDIKEFCGEATDDYERWRRDSRRQRTLIKKARGLMNTRLGNAMDTVPNDNETLSEFLRRARSIDEASQDIYAGKATATATSSATKTRRHALGD